MLYQDAGHSEDKSVRSLKPPTRQAAINARHKINELLENNALTVLFSIYIILYFYGRSVMYNELINLLCIK